MTADGTHYDEGSIFLTHIGMLEVPVIWHSSLLFGGTE